MPDVREVKFPETKHGETGKMVDFDAAAVTLKCTKEELTKSHRPQFIAWARNQP